jgi:hypothetical protein
VLVSAHDSENYRYFIEQFFGDYDRVVENELEVFG